MKSCLLLFVAVGTEVLLGNRKETGLEIAFMLLLRLTGKLGLFSELDKTLEDVVVVVVDDVVVVGRTEGFAPVRRSSEFGMLVDSDRPTTFP